MRTKLKRILSTVLACVMLISLLPATALAAIDRSKTSTVTFEIVNGTWKNLNFDRDLDATVNSKKTTVTFKTYWSTKVNAYVYKCALSGGTMESMLNAILNGTNEASKYISANKGYTLTGISAQDWSVNTNGGLVKNSRLSANEQMALIKKNTHNYDDHANDEQDGFAANTVYTLVLLKDSYSVTGKIDNGNVTNGSQTLEYKDTSDAMVFTPANGYKINTVTVNSTAWTQAEIAANLDSEGNFTYPEQTVIDDITVVVTTTLRDDLGYTVNYYKDSINDANLLKSDTGTGTFGDAIPYRVCPKFCVTTAKW